jgi:tRNA 5-methylaminomethyl-2-thiouridine biosynthesis bifunctional protein
VDPEPSSARNGDAYASRDGALGRSRHVFLGGTGLPQRWQGRRAFTIVETGFGLGVNFLATWQAWRDDPARCARLDFLSFASHPVTAAELTAHAPESLAPLAQQLAVAWPLPLPGLHRLEFEGGAVVLTLALGDARALLPQSVAGADAFFFDGVASERDPPLWEPPLLKALAAMARTDARLATGCSTRALRDALTAAGFEVEPQSGCSDERQMLTARFAPRWTLRRHAPPLPYAGERRAVVVGAGLAGCHAAAALARRGWQVQIIDGAAGPAAAASALPWGLFHPQFALDDNVAARLTRAGFLLGRRRLGEAASSHWQPTGVFRQAADEAEAARWRAALQAAAWPEEFLRWLDAGAAAQRLGCAPCRGGLWFAQGGSIATARWCRALLAESPGQIEARWNSPVAALDATAAGWRLTDGVGQTLATAPVVIIATALAAPALLGLRHAPVQAVRGRISVLNAPALAALRAGFGGDGYLARGADGWLGVGATYEFDAAEQGTPIPDDDPHPGNLQRLQRLLAAPPAVEVSGVFDGVRCVARDRLPFAGPIANEAAALAQAAAMRGAHLPDLPRRPGLYGLFALGSRGLTLAPLAAELIAAQIEGEPWPVERPLAAALDPARFLLRRLRRGGGPA